MQKVFVGGHPMAYHREGRGEPVLLVHGILAHSFIWREVVPKLAERHDVLTVDLLGCGDSTMPMSLSLSLKAQADYLAELIQWLGLGKVHFVGHEVGGAIGQVLAVRHPKTVRSLTLVNSVAGDLWPVFPINALRTPFLRQLILSLLDAGLSGWLVRRALSHREKLTEPLMNEYHRPLQTITGRRALLHFASCLESADLVAVEPELKKLAIPVNVIWGTGERYLPPATPERLVATFPGCKRLDIEGAGHLVPIDEPARLADALLQGFPVASADPSP
jgi:pimeloyl-ACP methyl ester carboxylesterase